MLLWISCWLITLCQTCWAESSATVPKEAWWAGGLLVALVLGGLFLRARPAALEAPSAPEPLPPPAQDPADPLLGKTFSGYHIDKVLGYGGMAVVYQATPIKNPGQENAVALKVIRPDQATVEFQERFKREIQVCMKLDHPNVVRILDWGHEEGVAFLVMDLVRGHALHQIIPSGGLPSGQARHILQQIVSGLAYAHSLGIVHRDLKPENVMVTHEGRALLLDFGLARDREVKTVTVAGSAVGTPEYMAPEQISSSPGRQTLNDRSDQYALGILTFEVLAGRRPFEWDDDPIRLVKIISMQLSQAPPPLTQFRPDLPGAVEAVVNKMLSKDPADRYPGVWEAGQELFQALPDVEVEAGGFVPTETRIRPGSTEVVRV